MANGSLRGVQGLKSYKIYEKIITTKKFVIYITPGPKYCAMKIVFPSGCNFRPLGVTNGTRGQKRPFISFCDILKSLPEKVQEFPDKKQ